MDFAARVDQRMAAVFLAAFFQVISKRIGLDPFSREDAQIGSNLGAMVNLMFDDA